MTPKKTTKKKGKKGEYQMSDAMITAKYQKMLLKDPNRSTTKIIEDFEGTAFRMRRKEAFDILNNLKRTHAEINDLVARNKASDMYPDTQAKIKRDAYKTARREALAVSIRGRKKGLMAGSIQDLKAQIYKFVDVTADYVSFYG